MAREPILFDAVLFDLDGTLVATERYWPAAARAGARRAFAELGLEREPPSDADWMGMVGLPLDEAFARVFADLGAEARARVLERCREEEHRLLDRGCAAPLPGALELLRDLRAAGVRLGIASNCSAEYLQAVTASLGLDALVHEMRCLHSPGVETKADMVADLLATFGTRRAVMVGDRESDMLAARAHGVPHVHLACGYASGERFACDAVARDPGAVADVLRGRARALGAVLDRLGFGGPRAPRGVVVTGAPGSGKSLLARDLVELLAAAGVAAQRVEGVEGADGAAALPPGGRPGEPVSVAVGRDPARGAPPGCGHVHLEVERDLALARLASREALELGPVRAREAAAERWPVSPEGSPGPRPAPGAIRLDGGRPLAPGIPAAGGP